jgi:flagellar motility protein MotE (MotC chaperone)
VQLRLIPIVLFAAGALLSLKALDVLGRRGDVSAVSRAYAAAPTPAAPQLTTTQRPAEQAIPPSSQAATEQQLLERLAERRRQLEDRGRELDQREALLQAAEKRLEERVEELRRIEQRIEQTVQARQEEQNQQLRGLVTMYENMKPKDAARIFDRLDMEVMVSLVTRMNPRRTAEILAEMQPEAAQRLTIELARRSGANVGTRSQPGSAPAATPAGARELPRIDQRRPAG